MQIAKSRVPAIGLLISSGAGRLADQMAGIVYGWIILKQTGSALWAGTLVGFHVAVLVAGTFFAGRLIGLLGSRRIAVGGAWLSVVSTGLVGLLLLSGPLDPFLMTVILTAGTVLVGPAIVASETCYPEVARIGRIDLMQLNVVDDTLDYTAALTAPAAGAALLVVVGPTASALAITLLCLVSAVSVTAAFPRFSRPDGKHATSISAVLRFLRRDEVLWPLTVLLNVILALAAALQLVVLPTMVLKAGLDSSAIAKFLAAAAVGSILGAVVMATLKDKVALGAAVAGAFLFSAAGAAILALGPATSVLLTAGLVSGIPAGAISPMAAVLYQSRPTKAMRADVQAVSGALMFSAVPVAAIVAGGLVEAVGVASLLLGIAVAVLCLAALAWRWLPRAG